MKHRNLKKFQLNKSSFVLFKFDFKNYKIYIIYYNCISKFIFKHCNFEDKKKNMSNLLLKLYIIKILINLVCVLKKHIKLL